MNRFVRLKDGKMLRTTTFNQNALLPFLPNMPFQ